MHDASGRRDQRQTPRRDLIPSTDAVVELVGCQHIGQSFFNVSLLDQNENGASMALATGALIQRGDQGRLYNPGQSGVSNVIAFVVRWVEATPAICCMGVHFHRQSIN